MGILTAIEKSKIREGCWRRQSLGLDDFTVYRDKVIYRLGDS